ncbi:unnamed protein product, partial [Prorocentrum cordatum]
MAARRSAQVQAAANAFFQKVLKDQMPQFMASFVRQYTVKVPSGPGSKQMQGHVKLTRAGHCLCLWMLDPEAQAVSSLMDMAMAECKAVQLVGASLTGPLERQ